MIADHAGAVSGTGPLRQPAALLVGIKQSLQDLGADLGKEQIVQWMRRAESIPETGIGVEDTRMNLSVIGAEIERLMLLIVFVNLVRIHQRTIHRAIKCALLVRHSAFDSGAAQRLIPAFIGAMADGIKIGIPDFRIQILERLLGTDKGGSDFARDDLSSSCVDPDISPNMLSSQ